MLDIEFVEKNKDEVIKRLNKRGEDYNSEIKQILELNKKRKKIINEANQLKHKKNKISEKIGELKRKGKNKEADRIINEVGEISDLISDYDDKLKNVQEELDNVLLNIPNIPDKDVPAGDKSNNEVVRVIGEKPNFDFDPLNHVEIAKKNDLIDYKRGVKLGGNGFWMYKNKGAIIEWALINFFIDTHIQNGYEFILPPHLLTEECGITAGQFPKFKDDVFFIKNSKFKDKEQFLLPTAETAIVNMHRDEIIEEEQLPKKYFAYTPCYRREAGSYRKEERGMIRGHQFNKVELFQLTTPEKSDKALEVMVNQAESLVKKLNLHYRITKLAAKDCSFAMAKTFDIEVWIPSMNQYKEVSSVSNSRNFQALRGNIRYKKNSSDRNIPINTLNASGLATSRLFPAIMEQNQNSDGSFSIPEVLKRYIPDNYKDLG
ncbi:MAG: serine--tRNA ligase [Candidatus Mcinerneyibacterium aminivorans]|uniref:Serine--tRNA ligase n=1 Tax=Candidatus Mcinerneyibacterium aminivorans TaxID=2703815 RepID=A0A5D0MIN5_9BACT|nr:MAG: serine--tRNA ligase [Candidatus Mcinerneyibacterium aminivorans]